MAWVAQSGVFMADETNLILWCPRGQVFEPYPNRFDCYVEVPLDMWGPGAFPVDPAIWEGDLSLGVVGVESTTLPAPSGFPGGGGGGGGGTVAVAVELTATERAELYEAAGVLLGVLLAAMAAVWGLKRVLLLLDSNMGRHDG